jgi:hypothetical protein
LQRCVSAGLLGTLEKATLEFAEGTIIVNVCPSFWSSPMFYGEIELTNIEWKLLRYSIGEFMVKWLIIMRLRLSVT